MQFATSSCTAILSVFPQLLVEILAVLKKAVHNVDRYLVIRNIQYYYNAESE